jgi:hypothetical protein
MPVKQATLMLLYVKALNRMSIMMVIRNVTGVSLIETIVHTINP